jgi:hypothetical protein
MPVLDSPESLLNSLFVTEGFLKSAPSLGKFSTLFHSTCQTCSENQLTFPLQKVEFAIFVPFFVSFFISLRWSEKFSDESKAPKSFHPEID